jgi:hypothetical protein
MAHYMNLLGHLTIFEHNLGGHTCGDTSCYLWRYAFYYFMEFWHGQNPIFPYLHGFILLDMVLFLFWGLTTSFLVERSIYLASCTFIHGVGCVALGFTRGLVTCILWTTCYFWRLDMEHSPRSIVLLFYISCTLEGTLCELC